MVKNEGATPGAILIATPGATPRQRPVNGGATHTPYTPSVAPALGGWMHAVSDVVERRGAWPLTPVNIAALPERKVPQMPILKNTRHESFAQGRIAGLTIDAGYIEAGYKPNRSNAARMNANEHIQQRIRDLQDVAAERAEIDAARVLEEICAVALSDIRDLFDQDGSLRDVENMPEKVAKAIQSIKVSSKKVPSTKTGETVITTEIKFWDKNTALGKLFKHFGLYEQKAQEDPMAAFAQALMGKARPLPVAKGCVDPNEVGHGSSSGSPVG